MKRGLQALILTFLVTASFRVQAQENNWLRWRAPSQCLQRSALISALGEAITASSISVEGEIVETDSGSWHALLVTRDTNGAELGRRTFESATCRRLNRALILSVKLSLQEGRRASAVEAADEPTRAPTPDQPASPRIVVSAALPNGPVNTPNAAAQADTGGAYTFDLPINEDRRTDWRVHLDASLAVAAGLTASINGGTRLAVRISPRRPLFVEASGTYWFETEHTSANGKANVSLWTAGGAMCVEWLQFWRASLTSCAGAQIGEQRATGKNFSLSESHSGLAAYGLADSRLGIQLGAFFSRASLALWVPLRRSSVYYETTTGQSRTLFDPWVVSPAAELSAGLAF